MSRLAEKLDSIADWFSGAGLGFSWIERVLYWWKNFGLLKSLGVAIAVFLPLFKFQILPFLASRAVTEVAQGYGVIVEVDDWSAKLLDLSATAEGLRVKTRGSYAREELLAADAVTLDLSLWGLMKTGRVLNEITVDEPRIYVERQLSGGWNWEEIFESGAVRRGPQGQIQLASLTGDAEDLEIRAPAVRMKNARVQWVENVPARSGGGVVQSQKAEIFLDDVSVVLQNVFLPARGGEPPMTFEINGRVGEGIFSIRGERRRAPAPLEAGIYRLSLGASPELAANIHLKDVGAGAIATIVHRARLVPRSGTVRGDIELVVGAREIRCSTALTFENVQYAPDFDDDPALRRREPGVRKILTELPISDRIAVQCSGRRDDENYRIADAIQLAVTREALRDAPPVVRAVAMLDQKQLAQPGHEITNDELTAELRAMGVSDDVASRVEQAGAISRGVKRVKEGFRRLVR